LAKKKIIPGFYYTRFFFGKNRVYFFSGKTGYKFPDLGSSFQKIEKILPKA